MSFRLDPVNPPHDKIGDATLPLALRSPLGADGNELCMAISWSPSPHDTGSSLCPAGGPSEPLGAWGNRGAARLQAAEHPTHISRSTARGMLGYTGKKRALACGKGSVR